MPVPIQAVGAEWQVGGVGGLDGGPAQAAAPAAGAQGGFGDMLSNQVGALSDLQTEASSAAQSLATGQSTDLNAAVMAVERAQLAMQLAVQVRGKLVDAYQDLIHTQV
jgi:flagellar hook-basal body complex protein FliE